MHWQDMTSPPWNIYLPWARHRYTNIDSKRDQNTYIYKYSINGKKNIWKAEVDICANKSRSIQHEYIFSSLSQTQHKKSKQNYLILMSWSVLCFVCLFFLIKIVSKVGASNVHWLTLLVIIVQCLVSPKSPPSAKEYLYFYLYLYLYLYFHCSLTNTIGYSSALLRQLSVQKYPLVPVVKMIFVEFGLMFIFVFVFVFVFTNSIGHPRAVLCQPKISTRSLKTIICLQISPCRQVSQITSTLPVKMTFWRF